MTAQNLKPAVKTRPHHGVAESSQFNQFNTINWYQQTWHTIEFSNNRHTRHHHNQGRGSLRSNLSNLPEPGTLCKSAFLRSTNSPEGPHPQHAHSKVRHILRLFIRGSVANSPHQRRRLELLYTPPDPHTNPPPPPPPHPQNPGTTRMSRARPPRSAPPARKPAPVYWLTSQPHRPPRTPVTRRRASNARRAGNREVAGPS